MIGNYIKGAFAACLLLSLVGCSMPKEVHDTAKRLHSTIIKSEANLAAADAKYETLLDENQFLKPYAKKEGWANSFIQASTRIKAVSKYTSSTIDPLLKEDKKKNTSKVSSYLRVQSQSLGAPLQAELTAPFARASALIDTKENAPSFVAKAKSISQERGAQAEDLTNFTAPFTEAHPQRITTINSKLSAVVDLSTQLTESYNTAQKTFDTDSPDYGLLTDSLTNVADLSTKFGEADLAFRAELPELNTSYTWILEDMRIDYFLQINRVSWNESSDFNTEKTHTYPLKQVTRNQFESMASAPLLATYGSGWGGGKLTPKVTGAASVIGNPKTGSAWGSGHGSAEYWVKDYELIYYNKYKIIEDGVERLSDWIEVDEGEYMDYSGAMGMSILSKAYGQFADEAVIEPHPPGYAFIDNPKYGKWENDSSGHSYWHYYGRYAMFNTLLGNTYGGHRYYRDDHRSWRSSGYTKPYYGRGSTATATTFGTRSPKVQTSSRYSKSNYAKTKSFSRPPVTIRGAGPSTRGGGPGGGGK
jgi:hypothetical protein